MPNDPWIIPPHFTTNETSVASVPLLERGGGFLNPDTRVQPRREGLSKFGRAFLDFPGEWTMFNAFQCYPTFG